MISASDYIAGDWSSGDNNTASVYRPKGFISGYAQHSAGEDFAEMFSLYVINDEETWNGFLESAGDEGAEIIEAKLEIVKRYMRDSWGFEMDALRKIVLRRENDVASRSVDLTDLTVN